jgi:hypothetical protein
MQNRIVCQNRAQNIKQTKAKQNRCAISRIDILLGVPKGKRKKDHAPSQERKKCPALIPAIYVTWRVRQKLSKTPKQDRVAVAPLQYSTAETALQRRSCCKFSSSSVTRNSRPSNKPRLHSIVIHMGLLCRRWRLQSPQQ